MANSSQAPIKKFGGNYEVDFIPVMKKLEDRLAGTNVKHAALAPHPINLHGIFIFGKMSTCPDKNVNWLNGWNVNAICNQHDIDRPGPDNAYYREILDSFETIVFDNNEKHHVIALLNEAQKIVLEYFEDDLPEVNEIDRMDPFCLIRFLQKVNNNYLSWVEKNSAKLTKTIWNEAQEWKGGNAEDFSRYIRNFRKMMTDLPPVIRTAFSERMIIDVIISGLSKHEDLKTIHTIIRTEHSKQPNLVTMQYIEEQVISVLNDLKSEVTPAPNVKEEVVASIASFFTQQKNRPVPRGKPPRKPAQSRSPISKKTTQRISSTVWAKMSQEARDQFIQEKRENQGQQRRVSAAVAAAAVEEVDPNGDLQTKQKQ